MTNRVTLKRGASSSRTLADGTLSMQAGAVPSPNLFSQLMMQEPHPRTRSSGPTLVVVTDDGTILECTPHEIGASRSTRETRWVFVAPDGAEHIGPHYTGFSSVGDIRVLANKWWESRKT